MVWTVVATVVGTGGTKPDEFATYQTLFTLCPFPT